MNDIATGLTALLTALDTVADALLSGVPSNDPHTGERLIYNGEPVCTPGFKLTLMSCYAADAFAEALFIAGHEDAARVALATHTEEDTDPGDDHHMSPAADWIERLAFADGYMNRLRRSAHAVSGA